jgi:hypothetical protein
LLSLVGRLPTNSIQVGSGHARGKEVQGSHGRAQAGSGSAGRVRHGATQRRGRRQRLRSMATGRMGGGPDGSGASWAAGGSRPELGRKGEAGLAVRDFEPTKPKKI